ncbi:winged helix-turn-helix transcriptional regulator [Terrisporobacter sp.]
MYKEVPPKVGYSLTESGRVFESVIEALEQWAIKYNQ